MSDRIALLESMLTEDPNDTFVLYAIAKEYEEVDQQKALKAYLDLKNVDPQYVGLYYHLGKLYEELGDAENAKSTYEDGIKVAKKLADFHSLSELNNALTNVNLSL